MVSIESLAQLINEGLSNNDKNIDFVIFANLADYENAKRLPNGRIERQLINGILKPLTGSFVPVKDLNNYFTTLQLELNVPQKYVPDVVEILSNYIQLSVGGESEIDGYQSVINFDAPMVGTAKNASPVGSSIPILTLVYFQFIKNGIISNNCNIFINGEKMLAIAASFQRVRYLESDVVDGNAEMLNLSTQQGLGLELTLAYRRTDVTKLLIDDILKGNMNYVYNVQYSDGFVDDMQWNMLLKEGATSYEPGRIPSIRLIFAITEADDG